MATLDRKRPYGESIGDPTHKYVQDNKLFNAMGQEVDAEGNLIKEELDKTAIIAQLEELQIEHDKRLSAEKLQALLEQEEAE